MPLTYREAVKLIRQAGGRFIKHGSEHDLFEMPEGTLVPVPRHRGDVSPGVERDIKKKISGGYVCKK